MSFSGKLRVDVPHYIIVIHPIQSSPSFTLLGTCFFKGIGTQKEENFRGNAEERSFIYLFICYFKVSVGRNSETAEFINW